MEIEKKRELILDRFMKEFDDGLQYIKDQVRHSLYEGVTGWLVNPIASWLYKLFVAPSIRDHALKNFNTLLECAQNFNGKEVCMERAMEIIEENFEELTKNDPSYQRFDKKHKKADEMIALIKEGFAQQLILAKKLLESEGDTYEEIIRNAFKSREIFEEFTNQQLNNTYKGLNLLLTEKKLLKVPGIIKEQTKCLLKRGYDFTAQRAVAQIDEMFSE